MIVTVDDDPSVSRAVARDLRKQYGGSNRIVRAESGADALDALKQMKLRGEQVAVILADYRMPGMNGIEFLEQAMDVYPYYGAALSEAEECRNRDAFVIGGANSAGQAAVYLAKYAKSVSMLVRARSLEQSMSYYLIQQIEGIEQITVRTCTEVAEAHGDGHLEQLTLRDLNTGVTEKVDAQQLFIFIGAAPRTGRFERASLEHLIELQQRAAEKVSKAPKLSPMEASDGEVSPYLDEVLEPGDPLELRGPIGGWFAWHPASTAPLLLLAGGSGIVPVMSIIRTHDEVKSQVPVRLIYSVRSPADAIYASELEERASSAPLTVTCLYTRAAPPGGRSGRISAGVIAELAWPPGDKPAIFACGPSGFVEAAASLLVDAGHDPVTVKTERFGPTGS